MKKSFVFLLSVLLSFSLCVGGASVNKSTVKENEDVNVVKHIVTEAEQKKLDSLPVTVKARSVVLMDVATSTVLLEYNPHKKLYPASVTKIMTLLLVAEAVEDKKISLTDTVTCSENAASKGGSQIWLEPGEKMTVDELLRATVIGSANDAATLLGEYVSGSETRFVDDMNNRARELGMKNTFFENATGLDDTSDNHLTTAYDIAIMSRELLKHSFITGYTTVWMDSLRGGKTELVNTNKLVRFYEGSTGLKTGTTAKAGCCVSASAKRGNMHLVAVVMGSSNSKDRFDTAKALLDWGFGNYTSYKPSINKNKIKPVNVLNGRKTCVNIKVPEMSPILIKKGEEQNVKIRVKICKDVSAPVTENQTLGNIEISVNEKIVATYKPSALCSVERLSYFDTWRVVANYICCGKGVYPESEK